MKIVKNVNPLLIAFLHGWQRLLGKQSHSGTIASKKWIKYQAPCGRLLRNTGEVEKYLGMWVSLNGTIKKNKNYTLIKPFTTKVI